MIPTLSSPVTRALKIIRNDETASIAFDKILQTVYFGAFSALLPFLSHLFDLCADCGGTVRVRQGRVSDCQAAVKV